MFDDKIYNATQLKISVTHAKPKSDPRLIPTENLSSTRKLIVELHLVKLFVLCCFRGKENIECHKL
jgi:hypothetical protein